jgi:hypothetical protein
MDALGERQQEIEQSLAAKHLCEGSLILTRCDFHLFWGTCPLAPYGYSRDKKKGKLQIIFGLLCNAAGCPIAVEVFEGNINDAKTLSPILEKVRERFGIKRVVLVGDRGVLTSAPIEEELKGREDLDAHYRVKSTANPRVGRTLLWYNCRCSLASDLASIQSPDYPGEKLIACRNPFLASLRAATSEALLQATEKELDKIVADPTPSNRRLVGAEKFGARVGKIINRYSVAKHFLLLITDNSLSYSAIVRKLKQKRI